MFVNTLRLIWKKRYKEVYKEVSHKEKVISSKYLYFFIKF